LEQIEQIVQLQFAELERRLADRRLRLHITDPARRLVAERGFDPVYGARPLRRFIAREVETKIGRAGAAGGAPDGRRTQVEARNGDLAVEFVREVALTCPAVSAWVRAWSPAPPAGAATGSRPPRGAHRGAGTVASRCPGSPTQAT